MKILDVQDVFDIPEIGFVIVGTNPAFDDCEVSEIKNLVSKQINIISPDKRRVAAEVKSVEVSTSLTGEKSLAIKLLNKPRDLEIALGCTVESELEKNKLSQVSHS